MLESTPGYRRPINPLPHYGRNLLGYLPPDYASLPRYRSKTAPDPTEIETLTADLLFWDHQYLPYWNQAVLGDRIQDDYSELQLLNEEILCQTYNLAYSPRAILQAMHININAIETGRKRMDNSWYDYRPRTHPAFVYNFLRYVLRNGLVPDLETALEFVRNPHPQLLVEDIFSPKGKIITDAAQLPPGKPAAFIHGRFLSVPHPGHEQGISALAQLKHYYPDMLLVVGVDDFGNDTVFANNTFRHSLLAQIPEIDYILPIIFSDVAYALHSRNSDYRHVSPLEQLPAAEQNAFYENLYVQIFAGRRHRFLHMNTELSPSMSSEIGRRCQRLGITPVVTNDKLWQSSVLAGYNKKPMEDDQKTKLMESLNAMQEAAAAECAGYARTEELRRSITEDFL